MAQYVVAVRMDDSHDFVVDPAALATAPSVAAGFPIGSRVRVTDVSKCFIKSDTMAETLLLGKWTQGFKPHEGSVATVLSSAPHPTTEDVVVVGIRSELDNRDFIIDASGLERAPNTSKAFTENTVVKILSADKAYTKMDAVAKELTLSKWLPNVKPQDGDVGVVLGSTAHPTEEGQEVIGVRTAKGQDVVIAPEALEAVLHVSKQFAIGDRVYISNIDKLFPKMEDVAKGLNLARWVMGAKPVAPPIVVPVTAAENGEAPAKKRKVARPLMTCTGEVKGSAPHPSGGCIVVGVRTETGQDFLVAEDGLTRAPQAHPEFPPNTRVKIADVGKVYPKWDDKAYECLLTRWVLGEKPGAASTGKVVASAAK